MPHLTNADSDRRHIKWLAHFPGMLPDQPAVALLMRRRKQATIAIVSAVCLALLGYGVFEGFRAWTWSRDHARFRCMHTVIRDLRVERDLPLPSPVNEDEQGQALSSWRFRTFLLMN